MGAMRTPWRHLIPVTAAVAIACLINPYGVRGALFPLELFPKISDPANPYKAYVDEFTSLREVMLDQMRGAARHIRTFGPRSSCCSCCPGVSSCPLPGRNGVRRLTTRKR